MRAIQIVSLDGPDAVQPADVDEPTASVLDPGGDAVVIDVKTCGVSFPELLQTRGMYQFKPELPFVPGSEVAGTVVSAPDGSGFEPGNRVYAFCFLGAFAERAAAPVYATFKLPDELGFDAGAAIILNYHTGYFCLAIRGRLQEGDSVLVQGAAGGVGTASIQVAKGLGAGKVIAVVSTDEKEQVARDAGADEVVRSDANWREQVVEMGGVDLVLDPVGGDRFTDNLRSLKRFGRVVVVGFAGGAIPEVKVNRLLLRNTEVVGAAWGEYVLGSPEAWESMGAAVNELIEAGHVKPIIGARYPMAEAAEALKLLDTRGATGKVILDIDGNEGPASAT